MLTQSGGVIRPIIREALTAWDSRPVQTAAASASVSFGEDEAQESPASARAASNSPA
jgi:hypothetical protein